MLQNVLLHSSKSGKLNLEAYLKILARLNVLIPMKLKSYNLMFKPLLNTLAGLLKTLYSLLKELKINSA
jgi:hypothetical protein